MRVFAGPVRKRKCCVSLISVRLRGGKGKKGGGLLSWQMGGTGRVFYRP